MPSHHYGTNIIGRWYDYYNDLLLIGISIIGQKIELIIQDFSSQNISHSQAWKKNLTQIADLLISDIKDGKKMVQDPLHGAWGQH